MLFFEKLPKEKNCPKGENSPNLVTLLIIKNDPFKNVTRWQQILLMKANQGD
jgi:hypothetical protein